MTDQATANQNTKTKEIGWIAIFAYLIKLGLSKLSKIDWKIIIALAALVYAVSFAFQVYSDYQIARANLKLRTADIAEVEERRAVYDAFGDKESENLKQFVRELFSK